MNKPSVRADIITRRTYNRPTNESGTEFETWEDTIDRVIQHQGWLWARATGVPLTNAQIAELEDLRGVMLDRKVLVSGRTLWLGGTDVAKAREASQFNCSHLEVETIHDVVDGFWLLLQGCGVGFTAKPGTLNGFAAPVEVEVIRSSRAASDRGYEGNQAYVHNGTFHLHVGDSAEAWAKSVGKLLAMKSTVDKVVLDFSEVRPAGMRLKGYGWISSGDETISVAFENICKILNRRAGELLSAIDIMDIMNWLGTTLSSRRSAEIALMDSRNPEINEFVSAKNNFFLFWKGDDCKSLTDFVTPQDQLTDYPDAEELTARANRQGYFDRNHRQQSNNTVVFHQKPSQWDLRYLMDRMLEAGGSEPGFYNAETALKRAPWFKGTNPCGEILLGNRNFCNLVEVDIGKFDIEDGNYEKDIAYAFYLAGRANYRQTCVNLDDGILQRSWHEANEFLRLCGVGVTGIVAYMDKGNLGNGNIAGEYLHYMAEAARNGANSMADELGTPRAKAITTVKPSGTLGKIMDTTEGVHRPLGRYIFNNVTFSKHEPIVTTLRAAGYTVIPKPGESDAVLVTLPVEYPDIQFDTYERDGETVYVNLEPALDQLERYKMLMQWYVDHNCSITVNYSPEEIPGIIDWIMENWSYYVGVSFILRTDPTKTAKDLGYVYLPQEVVTKTVYDAYMARLSPVDLSGVSSLEELEDDCVGGVCPIR